eukprot:11103790-Heterocapsa_arctica.AAC.1
MVVAAGAMTDRPPGRTLARPPEGGRRVCSRAGGRPGDRPAGRPPGQAPAAARARWRLSQRA